MGGYKATVDTVETVEIHNESTMATMRLHVVIMIFIIINLFNNVSARRIEANHFFPVTSKQSHSARSLNFPRRAPSFLPALPAQDKALGFLPPSGSELRLPVFK